MRYPRLPNNVSNIIIAGLLILTVLLAIAALPPFLNGNVRAGFFQFLRSGRQSPLEQPTPSQTTVAPSAFGAPTLPPTWTPSATPTGGHTLTPSPTPTVTSTPTATTTKVPSPTPTNTPSPTSLPVPDTTYDIVPFIGSPADHPAHLHGDLNLSLRGYDQTTGGLALVDYEGGLDSYAPQLSGLFEPHRLPTIAAVYKVNQWNFNPDQCDGNIHGCRGPADNTWDVTLAGFVTTPGEAIHIPERFPQVYQGDFIVLVLYAEEKRITVGYTREDSVANGYSVHIEGVCVDRQLLALYRAQTDANGWHHTGYLPALRNNEPFGTACGRELQVAIRDKGTFLDPRSRKDWWPDR
jgi:hypothetical protein